MKTQYTVVIIVVVLIAIMGFGLYQVQNEFETKAIYIGLTPDNQFEFLDQDDELIYFDSIVPNLKIDLYDEINEDREFHIVWVETDSIQVNNTSESEEEINLFRIIIKIREL